MEDRPDIRERETDQVGGFRQVIPEELEAAYQATVLGEDHPRMGLALGSYINKILGEDRYDPDSLYMVSEDGRITLLPEMHWRPMAKLITEHHDGHGLNESITLQADLEDPNAGGASHRYLGTISVPGVGEIVVARIQFQHGPRKVEGSEPGITEAVLYAILLDRLRAFQVGPFPHPANEDQIQALELCLASTKARADERANRGVLGKNLI
jgi:hypothetical protein